MKRFFCVWMILMMFCGAALADEPIKPTAEDLPMEEVRRIATEFFLKTTGFSEFGLNDFTFSADLWPEVPRVQGVWSRHYTATFTYMDNTACYFWVNIASPSGEIMEAYDGDFAREIADLKKQFVLNESIAEATAEWEKEKGPHFFWTYADKAAFYRQYGSIPGKSFSEMPVTLPEEGDLKEAEAIALAKEQLGNEYKLPGGQIDAMRMDNWFYSEFHTNTVGNSRCWVFLFRGDAPDESGMYPLLYQVNVPSPSGLTDAIRNMKKEDLELLGFNEATASFLTEIGYLYYNPDGGRFFHNAPNCDGVLEKYLPMTKFDTGMLSMEPYCNLDPCKKCVPQ